MSYIHSFQKLAHKTTFTQSVSLCLKRLIIVFAKVTLYRSTLFAAGRNPVEVNPILLRTEVFSRFFYDFLGRDLHCTQCQGNAVPHNSMACRDKLLHLSYFHSVAMCSRNVTELFQTYSS